MGRGGFKRGKVYERISLFPVRRDADEDDVQDLAGDKHDRKKKKPEGEVLAKEIGGEVHLPPWARLEDHETGDQFGTGQAKPDEELRIQEPEKTKPPPKPRKNVKGKREAPWSRDMRLPPRKRNTKAYSNPKQAGGEQQLPKINGQLMDSAMDGSVDFGMIEPRPFPELLAEVTAWHTLSGKDYEIWPFHVQKCADYLW